MKIYKKSGKGKTSKKNKRKKTERNKKKEIKRKKKEEPDQSGSGSNVNKGVLHTPLISCI